MLLQTELRFPPGPLGLKKYADTLHKSPLILVFRTPAVRTELEKMQEMYGCGLREKTSVFLGSQIVDLVYFCILVCDDNVCPCLPLRVCVCSVASHVNQLLRHICRCLFSCLLTATGSQTLQQGIDSEIPL